MQKLLIMSDGTYQKTVRIMNEDVDWDFVDITADDFAQLQETLPVQREKEIEVVD